MHLHYQGGAINMSRLRLELESLRVESFETDAGGDPYHGMVEGYLQTSATDYWTTLCAPPEPTCEY